MLINTAAARKASKQLIGTPLMIVKKRVQKSGIVFGEGRMWGHLGHTNERLKKGRTSETRR